MSADFGKRRDEPEQVARASGGSLPQLAPERFRHSQALSSLAADL